MTRNPQLPDPIRGIINAATPHVKPWPTWRGTKKSHRPAGSVHVGDRFGRWTVLSKDSGWSRWLVRCDCGTERVAQSGHLMAGQTKSCGCLRDELSSIRGRKHGEHKSVEYRAWRSIISRCNPTSKDRSRYAERGIAVCERWKSSFTDFLADMGRKPTPKHSVERIRNSEGYSPDNCCWATAKQQAENRRTNQYVVIEGEKITVAEAARRLGINRSTIPDYAAAHNISRQDAVDHYLTHGAHGRGASVRPYGQLRRHGWR